ncbi:hypothetical protein ACFQZZ_17065 [Nocardia sp. GCM10030253]|uniref:hypothetical protein n=1 Tax=Nocardia sp. GCM10030253 TaxID=3273404 RepID=UPI00363E4001
MRRRPTRRWAVGVLVAVAVVAAVWGLWPWHHQSGDALAGWEVQVDLPMPVFSPDGIAVASNGDVYVPEHEHIQKLPAGRFTPERVNIPGLSHTYGVAVGPTGDLFVGDYTNGRVFRVAADTAAVSVLPFTGLGEQDPASTSRSIAAGVAVDHTGSVFVTDPDNSRVVKLSAGSDSQVVVSTVAHLSAPIAVSDNGDLVVTAGGPDSVDRLLILRTGATAFVETTVPALRGISAIAFDHRGNLLLADNLRHDNPGDMDDSWTYEGRLWTIPAASTTPIRLPFTDLGEIGGIAVDPDDNILVTDSDGDRVLRLPRR